MRSLNSSRQQQKFHLHIQSIYLDDCSNFNRGLHHLDDAIFRKKCKAILLIDIFLFQFICESKLTISL